MITIFFRQNSKPCEFRMTGTLIELTKCVTVVAHSGLLPVFVDLLSKRFQQRAIGGQHPLERKNVPAYSSLQLSHFLSIHWAQILPHVLSTVVHQDCVRLKDTDIYQPPSRSLWDCQIEDTEKERNLDINLRTSSANRPCLHRQYNCSRKIQNWPC